MNQEFFSPLSEDVFNFIACKCEEFATALDFQEQGNLDKEHVQIWCQNLVALGYGADVVRDFFMLNPDQNEAGLEWLENSIEKWKAEKYKAYSCAKQGCTQEDIERCFGKCNRNSEGQITNSVFTLVGKKQFEEYQSSEEAADRMDVVLDKVDDGNKDAVFTEQALTDLAILQKVKPEKYEEILEELTDKKVDIKKLEKKLLTSAPESTGGKTSLIVLTTENAVSPLLLKYTDFKSSVDVLISEKGWLYGYDRGAEDYVPICNFIPEIFQKYIYDDDIEKTVHLGVRLLIDGSVATEEVILPAAELKSDKNLYKYFGDMMVIYGHYDMIRTVAFEAAKNVPTTVINYSLGWKRSDVTGKHAFCFSGDSLGDDTVHVADITELHGYNMQNTEGIALEEAFATYMELESLMTYKPGCMRVLCSYATGSILNAKLMELGIPPKFLIWLHGMTGSFKTEVGKLLCGLFGKIENPAANFQDTKASIEKKLHLCKDSLLLVDDFCPSASAAEERTKVDKANMVTRNIGDRVSRGRAKSNMTLSKEYRPRGNVIITGEDIIGGVSTLARNLSITLTRGDITSEALTSVQNKKEHLNSFMKDYIQYVKDNVMDECKFDLKAMFLSYRNEAQQKKHHRRLAETVANLRLCQTVFNTFLLDKELITQEEFDKRELFLKDELGKIVEEQNELILAEDPADLFLKAVSEMIVAGELSPASALKPDRSLSNKTIVFFEGDYYYFLPTSLYSKVVEYYRRKDKNFVLSERGVWNVLKDRGILEISPTTDGHADYKINKRIGKRNTRVIVIKKAIVESY